MLAEPEAISESRSCSCNETRCDRCIGYWLQPDYTSKALATAIRPAFATIG